MPALITTDLVALDADLGADKAAVVRRLAELVAGAGRATDASALQADVLAREAQAATGLPRGTPPRPGGRGRPGAPPAGPPSGTAARGRCRSPPSPPPASRRRSTSAP